jgi:hypothetical protein
MSCSGEYTGPVSGTLDVRLSSPNSDDGAALFTVAGGAIEAADALGGTVFTAKIDGNTTRVVVAGRVTSGVIARLHITDMRQAGQYTIVLNQVAVRSTYTAREPAGYSISLSPASQ